MRWPETGLTWVPTSPLIPDFPAVVGYPMTGLGCQIGGFRHGVGNEYPFRGISYKTEPLENLERELNSLQLPGLSYRRVSAPNARTGKPANGLYVEVDDWDEWRPTELSFYMMKLACKFQARNPFATATPSEIGLFLKLSGSTAFFNDIAAHGSHVNVAAYIREWQAEDEAFREHSRRYWLYR
jgi:uncharacterized protein YbbC (DUF1343 family)